VTAMRRRKIIVTIVALLCLGGFVAWRLIPRHDPRLVGTWLQTDGHWPSNNELERIVNGDRFQPLTRWELRADGSGIVSNVFTYGEGGCHWRTQGDRLFVCYETEPITVRDRIAELWGTLCGARPKRWHEYRVIIESAWRVRLEFGDQEHRQSHWENRLTRIEEPDK